MASPTRQYLPALEGIRGYAFLLVFFNHFGTFTGDIRSHSLIIQPFLLLYQLAFVSVPIFFALSGYLITRILLSTREKRGFFRTFYARRVLRVFPLYYLALGAVAVAVICGGAHLRLNQLSFLFYLENWLSGSTYQVYQVHPLLYIAHFWSLAVEEQFYLVWPLVIWFIPSRRGLLTLCYGGTALIVASHFAAAALHTAPWFVYENTFFRMDTILLGSALAVHQRAPGFKLDRLVWPAKAIVVAGTALLFTSALVTGNALPWNQFGVAVLDPAISIMGAAVLVLVLHPKGLVARACVQPWAIHLGQRSYSLYILHYLFVPLFHIKIDMLAARYGSLPAHLLGPVLAFFPIYGIAALTYRFIEQPSMNMKKHFNYGDDRDAAITTQPVRALLGRVSRFARATPPAVQPKLGPMRVIPIAAVPEHKRLELPHPAEVFTEGAAARTPAQPYAVFPPSLPQGPGI